MKTTDYSVINTVKQIKKLENYMGYNKILTIRPFANTYLGFIDSIFFGFAVPEESKNYWLMDRVEDIVDYYLDKIFFHSSDEEYIHFNNQEMYRPYIKSLELVRDKGNV